MEQSHKTEMANALRGDFARLRERGVATTFAPAGRPAAPVPPVATAAAPAPAESTPSVSWLSRFLSAR